MATPKSDPDPGEQDRPDLFKLDDDIAVRVKIIAHYTDYTREEAIEEMGKAINDLSPHSTSVPESDQ